MDSSVLQDSGTGATFDKVLFGRSLSRILSPPKPAVVSPLENNSNKIPEGSSDIRTSQEVTSRPSKLGSSRFSTLMIAFKPWRWRRRRRKNSMTAESTKGNFNTCLVGSIFFTTTNSGCDSKSEDYFSSPDMVQQPNGSSNPTSNTTSNGGKRMFINLFPARYLSNYFRCTIEHDLHVYGLPNISTDDDKLMRNSSNGTAGCHNKIQPAAGIPGAVATCLVGMSKFHVPSPTIPISTTSNTPAAPFIRRGSKTETFLGKQMDHERVVRGKRN